VVLGALAEALTVGLGLAPGKPAATGGGWWPMTSAIGTMMAPRKTVRTNVTAPHSRFKKDQFTRRRFYL
jgi:hypothetical protein